MVHFPYPSVKVGSRIRVDHLDDLAQIDRLQRGPPSIWSSFFVDGHTKDGLGIQDITQSRVDKVLDTAERLKQSFGNGIPRCGSDSVIVSHIVPSDLI